MVRGINMLKKVISLLLVVVLSINILTIAFSFLGLKEQLKWMPIAFLQVSSGSMEPSFTKGDLLLLAEVPYSTLKIGDTVTYHRGEELISHQIVSKESNLFVTQGISNNYKDKPIGPEEYCGKIVLVIPALGWFLEFLTGRITIILLAITLFILFYGKTIIELIYHVFESKTENNTEKSFINIFKGSKLRFLSFLTCLSIIFITPHITAAKYIAKINEFTSISASNINFSSNYLSEDVNNYFVQGWNSGSYYMNLSIKNYSNDLLANVENQDLYYGLCVEPIQSNGYLPYSNYTVEISEKTSNLEPDTSLNIPYNFPASWPEENRYGPYLMVGSNVDKLEHQFQLVVSPKEGVSFNPKDVIRFKVMAATSENHQFYKELIGDFSFEVAESTDFLREIQLTQSENTSLVSLSLKTNLINDGMATKRIKLQWNINKMYLNEFDSAAYKIILNTPHNYDKANGTLIMPMQAYSSVKIQFFKLDPIFNIEQDDLTVTILPD